MSTPLAALALLLLAALPAGAQQPAPMLFGQVAVDARHVAFSLAGDLWIVDRAGGEARRLTTDAAEESFPAFSPDGRWLAFSRQSGGIWDVWVMPAAGGEARRLTDVGEDDVVAGWTPDSSRVLFMSHREEEFVYRLYTVPVEGGPATELPLPQAYEGSYAPDGARIAYTPTRSFGEWRHYRGGQRGKIWITGATGGAVEALPDAGGNDRKPMWVGDTVYYLSDPDGTHNLYAYDLRTKRARKLTDHATYGIRAAAATRDAVAYVQDGRIHLFEVASGRSRPLDVRVALDRKELEPRTANASRTIESVTLSTAGDRVVVGTRGEAVLFDPATGTARNATETSSAAERFPALSPDGRTLAYFSDASGEYHLHLRPVDGGPARAIAVEPSPTFYRELTWSPDGKRVAFGDARHQLWVADVAAGTATRVDASPYAFEDELRPAWSHDGRWLVFSRHLPNRVRTVFAHDAAGGTTRQITDGLTHAEWPVFDRNGRYLYFVSSPNAGTTEYGWGVLKGVLMRPLVVRRVHALVLQSGTPAPVLPTNEPNPAARVAEIAPEVRIDFDGLARRVVDLPLPMRDYAGLAAGAPGVLFAHVSNWPDTPGDFGGDATLALYRVDLSKRPALEPFAADARVFELSRDGSRALLLSGRDWRVVPTAAAPADGDGKLDLSKVELRVDPAAEWRQIHHEAWRLMRDWFYDPKHHGVDLAALERHYAEYLPSVTRRADLNALIGQGLGHVSVSHFGVRGGDMPPPAGGPRRTGMLGADYEVANGKWRFKRVLRTTAYTSPIGTFEAPLDRPGAEVREGEYLLAVDGQPVDASRSVGSYLEGKARQPVQITVGPDPSGSGSRTMTVVPAVGENMLRRANWAERNRETVERLSNGRLGYIYVPDYGSSILDFMRGLAAYSDKEGVVVDQRYNGGGITADYLVEWLQRRPLYHYAFRYGGEVATPVNPFLGTSVLITNEHNGSAAETFAFMYQLGKVGPIVGMPTYGAGIGPSGWTPRLVDGGQVQIPNRAAFNPDGSSWGIENVGVQPDVRVEPTPADYAAGRDPQLERAVRVALERITPVTGPRRPAYPVHP